jgi:hypothetical protein
VAARRELAAECDRREGVPGVADGGEQDAAAPQSISASSRIVRLRSSGSHAMTDTISVPTPASR